MMAFETWVVAVPAVAASLAVPIIGIVLLARGSKEVPEEDLFAETQIAKLEARIRQSDAKL